MRFYINKLIIINLIIKSVSNDFLIFFRCNNFRIPEPNRTCCQWLGVSLFLFAYMSTYSRTCRLVPNVIDMIDRSRGEDATTRTVTFGRWVARDQGTPRGESRCPERFTGSETRPAHVSDLYRKLMFPPIRYRGRIISKGPLREKRAIPAT